MQTSGRPFGWRASCLARCGSTSCARSAFRTARDALVRELETFPDDGMSFAAMHPRLKAAMNVTDLAYFVAEHDDYHLARISELLGQVSGPEE